MAKPKALPQGVITSQFMFNKIQKEPDSLGLILLYGTEPYMMNGALSLIKKACLGPGGEDMDYTCIDTRAGDKFSFGALTDAMCSIPWVSPKRLVVVKYADITGKEVTDKELAMLAAVPSSSVVVFCEDEVDSRKKAFKTFVKNGTVASMQPLEGTELHDWIRRRFGKQGISIDTDAMYSLIARCTNGMNEYVNEIQKIILYCHSKGYTQVNYALIDYLCPPDLTGKIFDIMDACGSGDTKVALVTLDRLIATKEPIPKIRATITGHLKALILAKEYETPKMLVQHAGMNEFRAFKLCEQAKNFDLPKLFELYDAAVNADKDFKSGLIDERCSLELVLVQASEKAVDRSSDPNIFTF